jgi:hypothetical protein
MAVPGRQPEQPIARSTVQDQVGADGIQVQPLARLST